MGGMGGAKDHLRGCWVGVGGVGVARGGGLTLGLVAAEKDLSLENGGEVDAYSLGLCRCHVVVG
ncbi:hypothetical protein TIFTF001_001450 [Ficus carica]|uniref:Uncharacterized protein n=1 Tax=Ficus carica TaxID=3494 RepID=A0AA87ZMM2_FICCA|nr:hypothetical protein TIFTF001_001450 [Ficus carica]